MTKGMIVSNKGFSAQSEFHQLSKSLSSRRNLSLEWFHAPTNDSSTLPHFNYKQPPISAYKSINAMTRLQGLFRSKEKVEEFSRLYKPKVLDTYTKMKITKDFDFLFQMGLTCPLQKTLKYSKEINVKSVVYSDINNPLSMHKILKEEANKFNLKMSFNSMLHFRKVCEQSENSARLADKVLLLGDYIKQDFIDANFDENKLETLKYGPGSDPDFFQPKKNCNNDFRVLFLGHNSLVKGTAYLLEAWKDLKLNKGHLDIAGSQNRTLINRYKEKINFDYLGPVGLSESLSPINLYQRSSIYVLPSLGDGWPRSAMEAMCCELPVILTDRTGTADSITDGKEGFVIPSKDSNAIKDKIQYFSENPSEIKRMGRNARKLAKRFNWNQFNNELESKII